MYRKSSELSKISVLLFTRPKQKDALSMHLLVRDMAYKKSTVQLVQCVSSEPFVQRNPSIYCFIVFFEYLSSETNCIDPLSGKSHR